VVKDSGYYYFLELTAAISQSLYSLEFSQRIDFARTGNAAYVGGDSPLSILFICKIVGRFQA
jgi:hypothetical protein